MQYKYSMYYHADTGFVVGRKLPEQDSQYWNPIDKSWCGSADSCWTKNTQEFFLMVHYNEEFGDETMEMNNVWPWN